MSEIESETKCNVSLQPLTAVYSNCCFLFLRVHEKHLSLTENNPFAGIATVAKSRNVKCNITNYTLKKIITYLFLIIGLNSFSQENDQLIKLLTEKFPIKDSFIADDVWMYYPEFHKPKKLEIPVIQSKLINYELYSVNITNYLDYHVNDCDCLIFFDKSKNTIIFAPPLWYSGLEKDFYKNFIDLKFKDLAEIEKFVKEFQSIILNGTNETIDNTTVDIESVTFDIFRIIKNGAYRKIKIVFEKKVLKEIIDLNPKTLEIHDTIK